MFDLPTWDRVFLVTSIFCIITNLIKRKTQRHKAPFLGGGKNTGRQDFRASKHECLLSIH